MTRTKVRWRMRDVRSGGTVGTLGRSARCGFTLIEVVVATGILAFVVLSVFMLTGFSAQSFRDSEQRDTAKNIADYAIEYLRSRCVTRDNNFINTSDWSSGKFPGFVDMGGSAALRRQKADTDSINMHPVAPGAVWSTSGAEAAFYTSLQGYVSIGGTGATGTEDANAAYDSGTGLYCDKTVPSGKTPQLAPYVIRFPFDAQSASAIHNFTALTGYNGRIYTTQNDRTNTNSITYDPHYTTDSTAKAGACAYTGFRVLTQVVARGGSGHLQYYDVLVTVFWMSGSIERNYPVSTQITVY